MKRPIVSKVSVVMAAYNEQAGLAKTIQSILDQTFSDFEFIIVNDGSTDDSASIIQQFAELDKRIVVIEQANSGLTQALINGCRQAQGKYIARQDAGDFSAKLRLEKQFMQLEADPSIALSSTSTAFSTQDGEVYDEIIKTSQQTDQGLRNLDINTIKGPAHHGSVMFRRDIYLKAGGYRAQFAVAQDLDLWLRMIEFGKHHCIKQVLYNAVTSPSSISSRKREQQIATAKLIIDCAIARQQSGSDRKILQSTQIAQPTKPASRLKQRLNDAAYCYYIASRMHTRSPAASRKYYLKALALNPLKLKAWLKLLRSYTQ